MGYVAPVKGIQVREKTSKIRQSSVDETLSPWQVNEATRKAAHLADRDFLWDETGSLPVGE